MTETEWIQKLEDEGFTEVRVCPIPPELDMPAHTHDVHTVHVILDGELVIADQAGERVFRPGDRVEFPAGTTHRGWGKQDAGRMIVGVRNN